MTDEPVFDLSPPPRLKRVAPRSDKPRWAKARFRILCDDCLKVLAETQGKGPMCRQARWKRTVGGEDHYLCHGHALHWRQAEGGDPLQGMQAGVK